MKVSKLVTKTIAAATEGALDTAVATFVQGLKEEELISIHFAVITGPSYVAMIVYTN